MLFFLFFFFFFYSIVHSCSESHGLRDLRVTHTSENSFFPLPPGDSGVNSSQNTLWFRDGCSWSTPYGKKIKREALTPLSVHLQRCCRARGEAIHLLWQENKGVLAVCLAFFHSQQLFFFSASFRWVTLLMCQTSPHDGFQLAVGASVKSFVKQLWQLLHTVVYLGCFWYYSYYYKYL